MFVCEKSVRILILVGYRYHKLRKTFSKFYRRHYELISKYNGGLKTLLNDGLLEPESYCDLVYKFKKLIGRNDFSFQFRKIITRYRRIGYNLNVMRQSACLVFNPIKCFSCVGPKLQTQNSCKITVIPFSFVKPKG